MYVIIYLIFQLVQSCLYLCFIISRFDSVYISKVVFLGIPLKNPRVWFQGAFINKESFFRNSAGYYSPYNLREIVLATLMGPD